MTAHQDLTYSTLRAYADAWVAKDIERLLAFYAEDVAFHYFGSSDLAGTHVGKQASVAAMVEASSRASRELVEIIDILAGETLGGIVAVERLTRPDADIEPRNLRRVLMYRVNAEGQIAECWVLDEDQPLVDALWA